MKLTHRNHWIFDMDGTLTVAMHDFEAIRATLGLPANRPILESIASLPEAQAAGLRHRLNEIELDLARRANAQTGAEDLLTELKKRGAKLGILTRNTRQNAYETLKACNLLGFFEDACILGRESAPPKPNPDGIYKLLDYWAAYPHDAVMVGDYHFDLEAGRRAGTTTVWLDTDGHGQWLDQADLRVQSLPELTGLVLV